MAINVKPTQYKVLVVGCGGTGSAFLQNLIPYLIHRPDDAPKVSVSICDGDIVEEKNLARQVFFPDQVGMNKAEALAESIYAAYDFKVDTVTRYLEDANDVCKAFRYNNTMPILVGCVDNLKARMVYEKWFKSEKNCFYVDCANEEFKGEVVFASKFGGRLLSPTRSMVFPSVARLLKEEAKSLKFRSEVDCVARSISAPQHIYTNKMCALLACNAVTMLVESGVLPTGMEIFNMRCPYVGVEYRDTSAMIPKKSTKKSSEKRKGVAV